eukprot:29989-Pelagococcus_subviridis.AAC.4
MHEPGAEDARRRDASHRRAVCHVARDGVPAERARGLRVRARPWDVIAPVHRHERARGGQRPGDGGDHVDPASPPYRRGASCSKPAPTPLSADARCVKNPRPRPAGLEQVEEPAISGRGRSATRPTSRAIEPGLPPDVRPRRSRAKLRRALQRLVLVK